MSARPPVAEHRHGLAPEAKVQAEVQAEVQARLEAATAGLDPPFAVIDLDALGANASDLTRRAGGRPVRVASKSVRCRAVLGEVLGRPGFHGVMAYSVREALWLAREGVGSAGGPTGIPRAGELDILVGYPSADRAALRALAADPDALERVTLMIDDVAQLDLIEAAASHGAAPCRVCLDVDAALRLGPAHLGVRRSPLRTPAQVGALAARIAQRPAFRLVGVMLYEAQIAGLPDSGPLVRLMKRRSAAQLARRRGEVVAAAEAALGAPLALVNGGGTGSLEITSADPVVTEVTAGSGLYAPTLFDGYRAFSPTPAAWFALPVVRRPAPRIVTLFGGGYVASGPAHGSRLPRPALPAGLRLLGAEGAGEVQTPVRGAPARGLRVGDRVWLRHAKAGELLERFDVVHLVSGQTVTASVPTYRGEGRCFG